MTTLIFLAGCGAGAMTCGIGFLCVLIGLTRTTTKESKNQNNVTADLMKERNKLDERKVKSLERIEEWFENNWDMKG